jgi:hypothetical protein
MSNKILLKVGSTDLTQYLKSYQVDYNVLVKDEGRSARGNLSLSILNRKAKVNVVFRPLNETEMALVLGVAHAFVMNVQYWDTRTQTQRTVQMYVNTPTPNMYSNRAEKALYNDLSLAFIEL